MAIYEIGRLCLKIAGRDAGKRCVIVDVKDERTVLIDGETRRRSCNVLHLEPLAQSLDLKQGAGRDEVKAAFKKLGIELQDTKAKKAGERPRRQRAIKQAPVEEPKKAKVSKAKVPKAEPKAAPAAE